MNGGGADRIHGGDRKEIEELAGNGTKSYHQKMVIWKSLATMLADLRNRKIETFLYVNNHFEGSAPRTIARINDLLK